MISEHFTYISLHYHCFYIDSYIIYFVFFCLRCVHVEIQVKNIQKIKLKVGIDGSTYNSD